MLLAVVVKCGGSATGRDMCCCDARDVEARAIVVVIGFGFSYR